MHEQLPLIIELVLFTGFKEEAETLFCLSDELSKDFGLCYNMITLTSSGLICRASAKGDYNTVKNLCEFYTKQFDSQDEDDSYEYMTDRLYGTCSINYEVGPMISALKNKHIGIYNLLKKYNGRHVYHEHTESRVAELLVAGMNEGLINELLPCIEDINTKDFSENDIKYITSHLKNKYSEWADLCKDQKNYVETEFVCCNLVCCRNLSDCQMCMRCTNRDRFRIIGKVTPWSDFLYWLAIKLNISPKTYMVDIKSYYIDMCYCGCEKYSCDQQINDAWCEKIEKSHLDAYEYMRLKFATG